MGDHAVMNMSLDTSWSQACKSNYESPWCAAWCAGTPATEAARLYWGQPPSHALACPASNKLADNIPVVFCSASQQRQHRL